MLTRHLDIPGVRLFAMKKHGAHRNWTVRSNVRGNQPALDVEPQRSTG